MKIRQQMTRDESGRVLQQVMDVKQSGDALEIFIYDDIEADGYDWWSRETIESETSAKAIGAMLEQNADAKEIRMYVNSRGGSVLEAMGIRAHLLRHSAEKKTAYVDGWAASAASFILTACDEIVMLHGSVQMLHAMWAIVAGNADQLRKAADDLDRMMAGNRQIYLERSGDKLTEDELIQIMEAESWLTADECIQYGLADRIMASKDYQAERQAARPPVKEQTVKVDVTANVSKKIDEAIAQVADLAETEPEQVADLTDPEKPDQPEEPEEDVVADDEPDPDDDISQKVPDRVPDIFAALLGARERTIKDA